MKLQSDIWIKTNINDCATMSRSKSRHRASADTKDTRLAAAQTFVNGDRVRHKLNGKMGVFAGINLGFALPEVWIVFDSDTGSRIPISCNPLDLELAQKDCTEHRVLRELGMLGDTELYRPLQDLEVVEELVGSSTDQMNEAETQPISQEVRDMADTVDVPTVAAVEVVEELTDEEVADRHRLELKVERGIQQVEKTFYEIGLALLELRSRRLYRSTHRKWSDYCNERFTRINRRQADYFILAAEVIDDLKDGHNCAHFPLPTSESQVRSMKDLTPAQRREVWQTGVVESGGDVPTAKTVKGIVESLKERNTTPSPIPHKVGDVVLIRGMGNSDLRKYNGRWAIALAINEYTITVALDGKNIIVKPQFLEEVDPKYWGEIKVVHERIMRLQQNHELDPAEDAVLEVLQRRTCFTLKQMVLLERMEHDYANILTQSI